MLGLLGAAGEDLVWLVSCVLLLSGCLVLGVGVTGVCATIRESRGCMALVIALLILLLTLEGLACSLGILYQASISSSPVLVLQQRLVLNYGREGWEDFTMAMDYTQHSYSCCGDYELSVWRAGAGLEVPLTCCKLLNTRQYQAWRHPQPENIPACQDTPHRIRGEDRFTQVGIQRVCVSHLTGDVYGHY